VSAGALNKGTRWAKLVEDFLNELGFGVVRSKWFDAGDDMTAVMPGLALSVEAKNHRSIDLAGFVDQATRQAGPGEVPVVFVHRRGRGSVDDGYVVMTGRGFRLLVE
jgi:hypothetical protein